MSATTTRVRSVGTEKEMQPTNKINLYFSAVVVNIAVFSMGSLYGWSSPSLPKLQAPDSWLPIDIDQASWIGSLIAFGSMFGPLLGGWLVDHVGRRPSVVISVAIGMLSSAILYQTTTVWEMYVSRIVAGIGGGIMFTVVPLYISELSEDEVRSALASVFNFALMGGMLLVYSVGPYISYWTLILVLFVTPVIFLLTSMCVPESPYFHLQRNLEYKAFNNLTWLRKGAPKEQVVEEVKAIMESITEANKQKGSSTDLFSNAVNRRGLLVSCGAMLFQQLSGINVVIFYSQTIFEMAGQTSLSPSNSTILVGMVLVIAAGAAVPLAHVFGIRYMLLASAAGMAVSLGLMGLYFFLLAEGNDVSNYGWLPIASLLGYVSMYSIGFGPLPWALTAEVFSPNVKGAAAAITSSFVWAIAFVITKLFPILANVLGTYILFWAFAVFSLVAILFVLFLVPDTKGLSLQEVQDLISEATTTAHTPNLSLH